MTLFFFQKLYSTARLIKLCTIHLRINSHLIPLTVWRQKDRPVFCRIKVITAPLCVKQPERPTANMLIQYFDIIFLTYRHPRYILNYFHRPVRHGSEKQQRKEERNQKKKKQLWYYLSRMNYFMLIIYKVQSLRGYVDVDSKN